MSSIEAPRCQHIKTNGTQCGSPALKDNQFCYYHQHCRTITLDYRGGYRDFSVSEIHLPAFEDAQSILFTLRQVTELILRHKLDFKEAGLLLYALQIASSNLKRLELEAPKAEEVVTDTQGDLVETPEEAAPLEEFQVDKIDRIHGCAAEPGDDPPPIARNRSRSHLPGPQVPVIASKISERVGGLHERARPGGICLQGV